MAAILVIEDDEQTALTLFSIFFGKGHQVAVARCNSKLAPLEHNHADLVVFDVDSNYGGNGSYLPWLSAKTVVRPPMLLLASFKGVLKGLHYYSPARDDYLTKPFDPAELEAKVKALLRRYQMQQGAISKTMLSAGPLSLDVRRAEARVNGHVIPLTATEFYLLRYLLSSAGEVISGERLLRDVWGRRPAPGGMKLVRTHIKNLRAKIGFSNLDPFRIIQTIPRHGYVVRKDAMN